MNQSFNLYVHKFGKREERVARSIGAEKVIYEYNGEGSQSRINSEKKTISVNPELFFYWNNEVIDKVTAFVNEIFNAFSSDKENYYTFQEYLKCFSRKKLSSDIRLLVLAQGDTDAVMNLDYPITMKKIYRNRKITGIEYHSYLTAARNCLFIMLKVLKWPLKFYKKKIKSDHLLIPYYENVKSNSELFSLYNVINNSTIIVNNNSDLHKYLVSNNKNIVKKNDLYITPHQLIFLLVKGIKLLIKFPSKFKSPLLLDAVFSYIKDYTNLLSYFNSVNVQHVGVIRGDVYSASSLLREVSSSLGITTYSFSHSVYFYREYYLATVDYDWYGVSGQNEKGIYSGLWNDKMNYVSIGQITSGFRELDSVNNWTNINTPNNIIACVYPSSVSEQVIPNNTTNFNQFIDAVCSSCVNNKVSVFYKSKINFKLSRNDKVDDGQKDIDALTIEKMKKHLSDKFTLFDNDISVYDTFDHIDIGYVYSMSTVAFELIQNKKKVLVYWPFESNQHPFSKYTPLLVANNVDDFVIKAKKLNEMEYVQYEKYILSTLEYCLVPSDPNDSIDEFINLIESNHMN